jgi:GNAT superfamily N-acetyltransferase
MGRNQEHVEILVAPPKWRMAALRLLYPNPDQDSRIALFQEMIDQGLGSPDHLLIARRDDELVGVCWAAVCPGGIAFVTSPRVVPGQTEATCQALLTVLHQRLSSAGVQLAQATVGDRTDPAFGRLVRGGFGDSTELIYLSCDVTTFLDRQLTSPLAFIPFAELDQSRLARVIEQTYVQSRDFPALHEHRTVEQVLTSYRALGNNRTDRWFLVQHLHKDVGCLILNEQTTGPGWDLVYMGLVPEVRGRGWGRHLVQHAQLLAARRNCPLLLLGVDAQNEPAIKVYLSSGFESIGRELVLVKSYGAAEQRSLGRSLAESRSNIFSTGNTARQEKNLDEK